MQLDSEENRIAVIEAFPELEFDISFKITSNPDPSYNCIAWAANYSNFWWQPSLNSPYDGTFWPLKSLDNDVNALIGVFKSLKYEICDDWMKEPFFKKVALYGNEEGKYTHASRQLQTGIWTSKLGQDFDISHSTPFKIEGDAYGKVIIFMRKKM